MRGLRLPSFIVAGRYRVVKTDLKTSRLNFMVWDLNGTYLCCVKRTKKGNWFVYYSGWYRCRSVSEWLPEPPKKYYSLCGPKMSPEREDHIVWAIALSVWKNSMPGVALWQFG